MGTGCTGALNMCVCTPSSLIAKLNSLLVPYDIGPQTDVKSFWMSRNKKLKYHTFQKGYRPVTISLIHGTWPWWVVEILWALVERQRSLKLFRESKCAYYIKYHVRSFLSSFRFFFSQHLERGNNLLFPDSIRVSTRTQQHYFSMFTNSEDTFNLMEQLANLAMKQ